MSGYESDTCGQSYTIRIRYVWTQIFLYPHKKICGYKNLRPDTGNVKDCLELPPTNFSIFTFKNLTWRTYLISFTVLYCFPFCFVCIVFLTYLISSNLSCNLCLWYYDQLVHFDKEINANVYRHSLWEYSKRFYCSFEWHLTPHMTVSLYTN